MTTQTYTIAPLGLSETEHRVLKNIFKLSLYRSRSYVLWEGEFNAARTDAVIVEEADSKSVALWRTATSNKSRNGKLPGVVVVRQPTDAFPYTVRRPFVATRVLSALDRLIIEEFGIQRDIDDKQPIDEADVEVLASASPPPPVRRLALVVDDSRPIRKQLELELQVFGIGVDFAETGEEAIDLVDRRRYDLIFLDVVLPGVDGYQVCRTIKRRKLTRETPVIMLTSKSSPFDRIRGSFAGCDTYLTKPLSQSAFRKIVEKYLE